MRIHTYICIHIYVGSASLFLRHMLKPCHVNSKRNCHFKVSTPTLHVKMTTMKHDGVQVKELCASAKKFSSLPRKYQNECLPKHKGTHVDTALRISQIRTCTCLGLCTHALAERNGKHTNEHAPRLKSEAYYELYRNPGYSKTAYLLQKFSCKPSILAEG
jgi:hypothetical protein